MELVCPSYKMKWLIIIVQLCLSLMIVFSLPNIADPNEMPQNVHSVASHFGLQYLTKDLIGYLHSRVNNESLQNFVAKTVFELMTRY